MVKCNLCGFEAKNERGLAIHARVHKKAPTAKQWDKKFVWNNLKRVKWGNHLADLNYLALTLSLILVSVFLAQFIAINMEMPELKDYEVTLDNSIAREFSRGIPNMPSIENTKPKTPYDFNCKKFNESNIFGIPPSMDYFCSQTGYALDVGGTAENFEQSISNFIYYYALLHGVAIPEWGWGETLARERYEQNRDREELFTEWKEIERLNNEKETKIENLFDAYAANLRNRINKHRQREIINRLGILSFILSVLFFLMWTIYKNYLKKTTLKKRKK